MQSETEYQALYEHFSPRQFPAGSGGGLSDSFHLCEMQRVCLHNCRHKTVFPLRTPKTRLSDSKFAWRTVVVDSYQQVMMCICISKDWAWIQGSVGRIISDTDPAPPSPSGGQFPENVVIFIFVKTLNKLIKKHRRNQKSLDSSTCRQRSHTYICKGAHGSNSLQPK